MSKTWGEWKHNQPQLQGCWGCGMPWTALRAAPASSTTDRQPWAWYCLRCAAAPTRQDAAPAPRRRWHVTKRTPHDH